MMSVVLPAPVSPISSMCCELGAEFAERAGRVAKELGEVRTDPALRARPFKDDGIEDFDLIELVAFALEELPPLVDGGFNDRVVVPCKRYIGAIRFEEVLVDVKAGAECFQRGLQSLDRVLLFRVVKAFVIDARNAQNHAHIAALGEKGRLIPEAVEVDVV